MGRDHEVANCVLADTRVSRLHASFDIRGGAICVRDSGSTNGTFVDGQRIPHDRWVAAGTLDGTCEIRIAEWVLTIRACELQSEAASDDFLTTVPPEPQTRAQFPSLGRVEVYAGTQRLSSPSYPGAPPLRSPSGHSSPSQPSNSAVEAAWQNLLSARAALVAACAERLEETPPPQRKKLVSELIGKCPSIEHEPAVRSLFERNGASAEMPHTLESGAAMALQELARWYVNDQPPLANATEAFSFARKLKSGIDELLLGLVPMFAGLDRFEQQMDLRPLRGLSLSDTSAPPKSARIPRVPRDAARLLFNWRDPSDNSVRAVRTDLVDLTMHQVAVLNGVMRGVKQLLVELSPETLELAWQRKHSTRTWLGRIFGSFRSSREQWHLYRERHGDLADEENERFRVIFGPEFVAEYKQSGEPAHRARPDRLPSPPLPPALPGKPTPGAPNGS